MDTLTNYLKFSSGLDWLTIFAGITVILLGFILLVAARTRTALYPCLIVAFGPLLLGVLTTYVKNREIERVMTMVESVGAEAAAAGRREAMISTYVGGAGTVTAVLIGILGLATKRKSVT